MGTSLNDYEIDIASIIIGAGLELTLTVSRKGAMMDNYDQVANPNLIPCFEFSLPTLTLTSLHTRQLV
jgi:hypothetical protein